MRIVVLGLSISSSWGNGHATTYRSLLGALGALGHDILFLERDMPWYAGHRDMLEPHGCRLALYGSLGELADGYDAEIRDADAVIVGSYVPDGADVLRWVLQRARGLRLFYDIDTPVTIAKLVRGDESYLARASIPELDAYLSFSSGPALELIGGEFGAQLALPLFCSVDVPLYSPLDVEPSFDLGYLGTYSADRQPALDELLIEPARRAPDRRFIVAGAGYPNDLVWPENVLRVEHVPPSEHARFYASLRFALNITRIEMVRAGYSPSVRLFEAAACGVPIVSDRWAGIEDFFEPGREILLADRAEQILEYLGELPESERTRIGQRARTRVLREHTSTQRAAELDAHLSRLNRARGRLLSKSA